MFMSRVLTSSVSKFQAGLEVAVAGTRGIEDFHLGGVLQVLVLVHKGHADKLACQVCGWGSGGRSLAGSHADFGAARLVVAVGDDAGAEILGSRPAPLVGGQRWTDQECRDRECFLHHHVIRFRFRQCGRGWFLDMVNFIVCTW